MLRVCSQFGLARTLPGPGVEVAPERAGANLCQGFFAGCCWLARFSWRVVACCCWNVILFPAPFLVCSLPGPGVLSQGFLARCCMLLLQCYTFSGAFSGVNLPGPGVEVAPACAGANLSQGFLAGSIRVYAFNGFVA